MKVYKFFDILFDILLAVLYLIFAFIASRLFKIFPWYDADGGYMISFLFIWLPICVVTIIQIAISFFAKHYDKLVVSLAALNAVYIPLIFLFGYIGISLTALRVTCIIAILTMITYIVLDIRRIKKLR